MIGLRQVLQIVSLYIHQAVLYCITPVDSYVNNKSFYLYERPVDELVSVKNIC